MEQAVITAIVPTQRNPQRATIRVGRQSVGTLSRRLIDDLGLAVGQPWNDALANRVAGAVKVDKAMRQAMNRLNRRAMSSGRMKRKLRELGYEDSIIAPVIDRLTEIGALNDEAFGRALVQELLRQKSAGPRLIRARLMARGLEGKLIDRLIAEEVNDPDQQLEAARSLAQKRLRGMAKLDAMTRKRRLWGALARRGFGGETITAALAGLEELKDADESRDW